MRNEGIVGEGVELTPQVIEDMRPSEISFHIAKRLLYSRYRDPGQDPPMHLFGDLQRAVRRWVSEGYLTRHLVPLGAIRYPELEERAAELIFMACQRANRGEKRIKAILDAYNPSGSTRAVAFNTTKEVWTTAIDKSHVSHVVLDSNWEAELARVLERHSCVLAYAKNQGMSFDIPYRDGAVPRRYVPDFIVRLDDGRDDPLNLILETKGYRGVDAQFKAADDAGVLGPRRQRARRLRPLGLRRVHRSLRYPGGVRRPGEGFGRPGRRLNATRSVPGMRRIAGPS